MLTFLFWLMYSLFMLLCVILILLVLIQKGRGGGLSSAFGGGGSNTAFGSKTGDVLTWATSIVFGVFMLLAVGLNLLANHQQQVINSQSAAMTHQPVPAQDGSGLLEGQTSALVRTFEKVEMGHSTPFWMRTNREKVVGKGTF